MTGLVDNINAAALAIDFGRKGYATRGKAEQGRISYEKGIALAMTTFEEAQTTADPQTIILAEYTFISQEFQFCEKTDKDSLSSLTVAVQSFDDAFLALEVVKDKAHYQYVDKAIPHSSKHRVKGFPMDAYHIACHSHKTRLRNILKTPGLDPIEKALLKQPFVQPFRRARRVYGIAEEGYLQLNRDFHSFTGKSFVMISTFYTRIVMASHNVSSFPLLLLE